MAITADSSLPCISYILPLHICSFPPLRELQKQTASLHLHHVPLCVLRGYWDHLPNGLPTSTFHFILYSSGGQEEWLFQSLSEITSSLSPKSSSCILSPKETSRILTWAEESHTIRTQHLYSPHAGCPCLPTSGFLELFSPLPDILFPLIFNWLTSSAVLGLWSNVTFSVRSLLTTLYKIPSFLNYMIKAKKYITGFLMSVLPLEWDLVIWFITT